MDIPVEITLQGVLSAAGTVTLTTPPVPPWKAQRFTRCAVFCTSVNRTRASIYRNGATPANLIDSADVSGNNDTTDTQWELRQGEYLTLQWTGGDPGSTATATLSGVQTDAVS